MVAIRKNLVPASKYGVKCPYGMNPQYITIHNTANDASADAEVNYMIGNNNEVSFHVAVDDKEAVQGIPFERNTWNAGDGNGQGNRNSISIEICYSKSGGSRYYLAEGNAVQLVSQLLKERGWGIDRVKKHQDWSGKHCPHRILDEGRWQNFLNAIQDALGQAIHPVSQPVSIGIGVGSIVTVQSYATNYADGKPIANFVKGSKHKIIQVKDWVKSYSKKAYLLADIMGWVLEQDIVESGVRLPQAQPETSQNTFRIKTIPSSLWYYDKPDWNAKKATVPVGTVLTVVDTLTIAGSKMYKLKSGTYITANPQYVQVL
jgi:N-acetylmuramoyl-L-alanine amidase CwlA